MSRLFISSSPDIFTLEGYVAEVHFPQDMDAGILQTTKAKCRELARSVGDMLVSPTLDSMHVCSHFKRRSSNQASIWIVAKMDFLRDSRKVQEKLSELNITLKQKVELSHMILETCYKFSAIARLAPKWNMISTWLVQGSEFFSTSKSPGLDFEVAITTTDITLHLNTHKLSFSFLKPDDLGLTPIIINRFKINPSYIISEKNIATNRCLVLPNLTTAFVYSVSHHLQTSPEFPTYDKLRLHWKKQHGMILPDVQVIFYQVFFGLNSQRFFSYPGCCVLKNHPLIYPNPDPDLTAFSFLADLRSRFPTLCGSSLSFSTRALAQPENLNSMLGSAEISQSYVAGSLGPQEITGVKPNRSQDGGFGQLTHCQKPQRWHSDAESLDIPHKNAYSSTVLLTHDGVLDLERHKGRCGNKLAQLQSQGTTIPSVPPVQAGPNIQVAKTSVLKDEVSAQTVRPSLRLSLKKRVNTITSQQTPEAKKQCSASCHGLHIGNKALTSYLHESTTGSQSLGFTLPQPHLATTPVSQSDIYNLTARPVPGIQPPFAAIPVSQSDIYNMTARPMPGTRSQLTSLGEAVSADTIKKIERSTITDLRTWLNKNKIKFRSKDKKSDLVLFVTTHIGKARITFP